MNAQQETAPVNDNTSGQGESAIIPSEIKGWNWGAFGLSWIWGLGNKTYIALLAIIGPLSLIMAIVLGIKGNEWAWKNKKWDSVEHFKKVQRKWTIAWLIILGTGLILAGIGVFFTIFALSRVATEPVKSPIKFESDQSKSELAPISDQTTEQKNISNMDTLNTSDIQLPQTLTDDEVGFSINYPNGWKHARDEDKESNLLGTLFGPDVETPPITILVQKFEPGIIVDAQGVEAAIKNLEQADIDAEGKIYEESDFIYKFDDETTVNGKQFVSETYTVEGNKIKKWLAAVPNGNKLVWFAYLAPVDQYDAYYKTAAAMFKSWKILK